MSELDVVNLVGLEEEACQSMIAHCRSSATEDSPVSGDVVTHTMANHTKGQPQWLVPFSLTERQRYVVLDPST